MIVMIYEEVLSQSSRYEKFHTEDISQNNLYSLEPIHIKCKHLIHEVSKYE